LAEKLQSVMLLANIQGKLRLMSQIPSNAELKRQIGAALKAGADLEGKVDSIVTISALEPPVSEDFKFFHKLKASRGLTSVDYASNMEVAALTSRFKIVVAANAKTKRHIMELMDLMAEIANGFAEPVPMLGKRSPRRLQWLFYVCIGMLGLGWFLLFPSGHVFVGQTVEFLLNNLFVNHYETKS
jgi:hypothetical protein